ncbi:MAG: 6-phosphogluconolactonase [Oleiphilaceae bacterium]|nr:6-phosphogluconolactonase [Oleiphilus sp. HI0125]KZZ62637.1 hypothetical protein A3762_13175 [Oleiphilus sp. HI0125]MCH2159714.1 6-phosphogluconolactonase [Oleiphilaceae bacterium]
MFEIKVYNEVDELLEHLAEQLMAYSLRSKPCHIALSGGSTPKALYALLAMEPFNSAICWDNLHFWWGDERMVEKESAQSNFGEAYRTLFQHVPIPEENLHPINGANELSIEQVHAEEEIVSKLDKHEGRPCFDWVLLGLGEDGHTASLFPGQVDYEAQSNWVAATHPETGEVRLSLSAETLCNARSIAFVVTGANKAEIVRDVFGDEEESEQYPAANIFAFDGETQWLLDEAAASLLVND